jgi:hypothetical protein
VRLHTARRSFSQCTTSCYSGRLHYMSYDMIVQPLAFRYHFLWHYLPAVLSSDKSEFGDEVSFRRMLQIPGGFCNFSGPFGAEALCSLKPCDPVFERTLPFFRDLLNTPDWSGTRFLSVQTPALLMRRPG